MKTHFKKSTVIAIAAAISFLAACTKDRDHASPLSDYKVTDRTIVNNEDGSPRATSTLAVLDETVALRNEALNAGQVAIKNSFGKNLLLTVAGNKDGKLTLAQPYAATEGRASGTIYYTLVKK